MIIIKPDNLEQDLKYCCSSEALQSWDFKEKKLLEGKLVQSFNRQDMTIGATLNDGGQISRNLRNYLPAN